MITIIALYLVVVFISVLSQEEEDEKDRKRNISRIQAINEAAQTEKGVPLEDFLTAEQIRGDTCKRKQ